MYNRSNCGTFYTRKVNLVCYLGHNLGTLHARKLKFGTVLSTFSPNWLRGLGGRSSVVDTMEYWPIRIVH